MYEHTGHTQTTDADTPEYHQNIHYGYHLTHIAQKLHSYVYTSYGDGAIGLPVIAGNSKKVLSPWEEVTRDIQL